MGEENNNGGENFTEDIYLTKHKIKEVIINGEKNYFKKGYWGWKQVHIIKKNLTEPLLERKPFKIHWKNIHWENFIAGGRWINLGIIALIVIIVLGSVMEYSTALKITNDCLNNSCVYCQNKLSDVANISFSIK